jgi:hypothetical protein
VIFVTSQNDFYQMLRKLLFVLLFLCSLASARAQELDISGQWKGYITLEGRTDTFWYELDVEQQKNSLSGLSFCFTKDTSAFARFNLTGVLERDSFVIQEIQQYQPLNDKWCHKYMILKKQTKGNTEILSGSWAATNCPSGTVFLSRTIQPPLEEVVQVREVPFSMAGKWTGTLQQEDRSADFRFEINLDENNKGESFILSDGEGGSARIELVWSWGLVNSSLRIQESRILDKSDPDWPWCIKTVELQMRREGDKYILAGPWKGHIDGFDMESGPCASGYVYLEKPVLQQTIAQKSPPPAPPLPEPEEKPRKIKVQKIVEVQSRQLRLRAWDSGTVDGDVITIFLNGEQVLFRHQVSKRRYAFPITLKEDHNFMVMYADDIGDIVPNTVAVSIDDGVREQMVVLSSDLEESGAVLLKKIEIKGK